MNPSKACNKLSNNKCEATQKSVPKDPSKEPAGVFLPSPPPLAKEFRTPKDLVTLLQLHSWLGPFVLFLE